MIKLILIRREIKLLSLCIIFFMAFNSQSFPQIFQNLRVTQSFDTVKIQYDVNGGYPDAILKVKLSVSEDGGKTFPIIPISVQGDIGDGVTLGKNKLILWEPLKDSIQLVGNNFKFNLNGSVIGAPKNFDMIKIKGGTFEMGDEFGEGSPNETYMHKVKLSNYEISAYEITNIQFYVFLKEYGDDHVKSGEFEGEPMIYETSDGLKKIKSSDKYYWTLRDGKEYYPVVGVTWYGANEFCRYYGFRLPTEAEWEYAAREKGKKIRFGDGKDTARISEMNFDGVTKLSSNIKFEGKSKERSMRIGSYIPNSLGLYDMSGNVWEWCQDWYKSNYYLHSRFDEPTGPWLGEYKVIRGGSWYSSAYGIRTTARSFAPPVLRKDDIGFRVACFTVKNK